MELEKAECTNHVLTLIRRIDELRETITIYESAFNEKREEIALLNQEQKRLDNLASNNENVNKNDDSNAEVIYASGD